MGERPTPDAPHPGKERPPWAPLCSPHSAQSQLARARAVGLVTGPHARSPPHPQPVGSGPRPHARKDEWSGLGERPPPDAPHPDIRRPPGGPSCRPHSAQSQLARALAVGLLTVPHTRSPRAYSQWVVGPGRTPEGMSGRGWESARPRMPRTQARGAPPRVPACRPYSAQSQLARPARKSARGGVGDGSPRPHPGHGERAAPGQVGGNGNGPPPPPPPQASQMEHGTEAGHAEGHGPSGTALPAPSTGTARGARATPTWGGGGGADAARAQAHTHTQRTHGQNQKGDRTEPAERTDRMKWRTSERG